MLEFIVMENSAADQEETLYNHSRYKRLGDPQQRHPLLYAGCVPNTHYFPASLRILCLYLVYY